MINRIVRPIRDNSKCYYWALLVDGVIIFDGEAETVEIANDLLDQYESEYKSINLK